MLLNFSFNHLRLNRIDPLNVIEPEYFPSVERHSERPACDLEGGEIFSSCPNSEQGRLNRSRSIKLYNPPQFFTSNISSIWHRKLRLYLGHEIFCSIWLLSRPSIRFSNSCERTYIELMCITPISELILLGTISLEYLAALSTAHLWPIIQNLSRLSSTHVCLRE